MILKKKKEKIYLLLYPARAAQSTFAGPTDNPQTHKTKIEKKGPSHCIPDFLHFSFFQLLPFLIRAPSPLHTLITTVVYTKEEDFLMQRNRNCLPYALTVTHKRTG